MTLSKQEEWLAIGWFALSTLAYKSEMPSLTHFSTIMGLVALISSVAEGFKKKNKDNT